MNNNDSYYNLGERLQNIRTSLGLSQEQIALRANITTTYYGLIERNVKNPSIHIIEKICGAFHISLADFFMPSDQQTNDILTEQIQLLLQTCTEQEKSVIYNVILQILLLRRTEK